MTLDICEHSSSLLLSVSLSLAFGLFLGLEGYWLASSSIPRVMFSSVASVVSSASRISSTSSVVFALVLRIRTAVSSLVILSVSVGVSSGRVSGYLFSKYDHPIFGCSANTMLSEVPEVGYFYRDVLYQ